MQQIDVLFPPTGDPVVHENTHAVIQEEILTWRVRSENPSVARVKIEFSGPDPGFFPMKGTSSPSITRELSWITRPSEPSIGLALVWGQAPRISAPETSTRRNKYTVTGLDANGNVVGALDPQIITEHP